MTAPRVYAFESGSVRAFRGWKESRPKDEGELFEHLVLNELHAHLQQRSVRSRRTKRGEERGAAPIAIECRRQADEFDPKALQVLRSLHAGTRNPSSQGTCDARTSGATARRSRSRARNSGRSGTGHRPMLATRPTP
ncbi:MAG: hypothetical protein IT457_20865 [Planctomycetes bacterium]|nr:hypothetical protein [Planctomycetota bacterium]